MQQYIGRRLLQGIVVIFFVSLLVAGVIRILPGDILLAQLGETGLAREKDLERARQQLGLSDLFPVQYAKWISGVFQGDLGESLWTGRSVAGELIRTLPVTVELTIIASVIGFSAAILLGVVSAVRQGRPIDHVVRVTSITGLAIPEFWLGTLFVLFMAIQFTWSAPLGYKAFQDDPWINLQQVGPASLILSTRFAAVGMRLTRSSMLEVLRQDYVRTAWAKGLRERQILIRHALKNAMIPVITVFGIQFAVLLGGTVILEVVFGLPGLGRLTVDAVLRRDYPTVQGNVLFIATVLVFMNLVVDITYAWFDPRIRYR